VQKTLKNPVLTLLFSTTTLSCISTFRYNNPDAALIFTSSSSINSGLSRRSFHRFTVLAKLSPLYETMSQPFDDIHLHPSGQ
jgi:hypothetical protein